MSICPASEINDAVLSTDVAIIGAGPAGLSLAAGLGRDCLVVESGSLTTDRRTHHFFHSINTGESSRIDSVRVRGVGGASLRWTGRCAPLDPYDFEDRPWICETGWPIPYAEISAWSDQAAQLMALPDNVVGHMEGEFVSQVARDGRFTPARWQFAEDRRKGVLRFGDHLRDAFCGDRRRLVYEAHCVEIMGNSKSVSAIRVIDRKGRSFLVTANHFVIASGCVENCRSLLQAQRTNPELLGSVYSWLGRGFGQHLRLDAGEIVANTRQIARLQRSFDIHRISGCAVSETGLKLNAKFARAKKLGNASLVLRYEPKRGLSPLDWIGSAKSRLAGHAARHRKARVLVEIDTEQAVDHESYISLADELDPLGSPRAKVHWRINQVDRRTAHETIESFASFIERVELGRMEKAAGITPEVIDLSCRRDSLHQIGGTRMSENAKTGVVDSNLLVHGTPNLSVVGGSVFSTGGHANPTQTIVALAMRLADHLNGLSGVSGPQFSNSISDSSLTA